MRPRHATATGLPAAGPLAGPAGIPVVPFPPTPLFVRTIEFRYAAFMAAHLQSSLFDQETKVGTRPLGGLRRTDLGHGAWIDVLPQWLRGAAAAGANITLSGSGYNTGQGV